MTCIVPGCGWRAKCKGRCSAHDQRMRRGLSDEAPLRSYRRKSPQELMPESLAEAIERCGYMAFPLGWTFPGMAHPALDCAVERADDEAA